MSTQPTLLEPVRPPDLHGMGVRLYNTSWRELPREKATFAIIDPPWKYSQRFGESAAADHYPGLPTSEIKVQIDEMAEERLERDARIALWLTWPILPELWGWLPRGFRLVTGGAWTKSGELDTGHYGQGYHWAGCSEPVLVFIRGKTKTYRNQKLRNAWIEPPNQHSRKPVAWMEQWLRRWTDPGDLVFSPYAGLCPEGTACLRHGRRLLAAEISPVRHAEAMSLLVQGM